MDRTGSILLALLVALAGCSGFSATGGDDTPVVRDITPAAIPDDGPSSNGAWVAPGLTERDLVDVNALVDAHTAILSNTSYTVTESVVERDQNGTVRSSYRTIVEVSGDRFAYQLNQTARAEPAASTTRLESWSDGERVFVARTTGATTEYDVRPATEATRKAVVGSASNGRSLGQVFRMVDVAVTGREQVDGEIRYRVSTPEPRSLIPLRNVTVTASVSPDGLVHEFRVTYEVERGDDRHTVSVQISFDGLGETRIDRPIWFDSAVAATTGDTSASEGRVVTRLAG